LAGSAELPGEVLMVPSEMLLLLLIIAVGIGGVLKILGVF
jgi:hypothetical protein